MGHKFGDKVQVTISNRLYGDRVYNGYGNSGLAVYKRGSSWTIACLLTQSNLSSRLSYPTCAAAAARRDEILEATPNVNWEAPIVGHPAEIMDARDLFLKP